MLPVGSPPWVEFALDSTPSPSAIALSSALTLHSDRHQLLLSRSAGCSDSLFLQRCFCSRAQTQQFSLGPQASNAVVNAVSQPAVCVPPAAWTTLLQALPKSQPRHRLSRRSKRPLPSHLLFVGDWPRCGSRCSRPGATRETVFCSAFRLWARLAGCVHSPKLLTPHPTTLQNKTRTSKRWRSTGVSVAGVCLLSRQRLLLSPAQPWRGGYTLRVQRVGQWPDQRVGIPGRPSRDGAAGELC